MPLAVKIHVGWNKDGQHFVASGALSGCVDVISFSICVILARFCFSVRTEGGAVSHL